MERKGNIGGTSGTFIFLKQRTVKMAPLKKIAKPKTLEELKSEAMKVYNNTITINSFYTESGDLIDNIKQIKSGSTVYVSSIKKSNDTKFSDRAKKIVDEVALRSPTGLKKIPKSFKNETKPIFLSKTKEQVEDNDISYDEDPDFDKVLEEKPTEQQEEHKEEKVQRNEAKKQEEETPKVEENHKTHKRRKIKRSKKENKEEEKPQEQEQQEPNEDKQEQEAQPEKREESQQEKQEEEKKENQEEIKEKPQEQQGTTTFDDLFNMFNEITGMNVSNAVKKSVNKKAKQGSMIFKNCIHVEELQACRWYNFGREMLDSAGITQPDDIIGKDDLIKLSRNTISNHRRVLPGGFMYTMNTCVRGLEHSGVTTLLSVLANEFLIDLVATEAFKKNFVVVYDTRDLLNDLNPKQLFHTMLQITLDHIKWHRPDLIVSLPVIKKCIESVFEASGRPVHVSRSAKIDQLIAASLETYASELSAVWANESMFSTWVRECISMPIRLGKLLGFKNFTIIANDIDTALLISSISAAPFEGSMVSLNDIICPLLNNNSYIVSCKSFDDFDIQMRCAENTTFKRSDTISTLDLIHVDDPRTISAKLEGRGGFFTFDVTSCGGIPSFVSMWINANELLDELDRIASESGEDSEEYDEQMLACISAVEELIQTIFLSPKEGKSLIVESVKRNQN